MLKSLLLSVATLATIVTATCPTYVGRAAAYPVGTIMAYNGANYEVTRELGNGWISPSDPWFWTLSTNTCTATTTPTTSTDPTMVGVLQQILSELTAVKNVNNQILASMGTTVNVPTEFTDARDGKVYPIVRIGADVWMAADLAYAEGGICEVAGCRYDWSTANGVCPSGWHLPSHDIAQALLDIGGEEGTQLRSTTGWISKAGTNQLGFNALPVLSGGGGGQTGYAFAQYTKYWTGNLGVNTAKANALGISLTKSVNTIDQVTTIVGIASLLEDQKTTQNSVRCVRQ
jgi:uncharacterized protein (TIGR02145 family)